MNNVFAGVNKVDFYLTKMIYINDACCYVFGTPMFLKLPLIILLFSLLTAMSFAAEREYLLREKPTSLASHFEYEVLMVDENTKKTTRLFEFSFDEFSEIDHFVVVERDKGPVVYARTFNGFLFEIDGSSKTPHKKLGDDRIRFLAAGPDGSLLFSYSSKLTHLEMMSADGTISSIQVGNGELVGATWNRQASEIMAISTDPTTVGRFGVNRVLPGQILSGANISSFTAAYFNGTALLGKQTRDPRFVSAVANGDFAVGVIFGWPKNGALSYRLGVVDSYTHYYSIDLPTLPHGTKLPKIVVPLEIVRDKNGLFVWLRVDSDLVELEVTKGKSYRTIITNVFSEWTLAERNPNGIRSFSYAETAKNSSYDWSERLTVVVEPEKAVSEVSVQEAPKEKNRTSLPAAELKALTSTVEGLIKLADQMIYIDGTELGVDRRILNRLQSEDRLERFMTSDKPPALFIEASKLQKWFNAIYNANYEAFVQNSIFARAHVYLLAQDEAVKTELLNIGLKVSSTGRLSVIDEALGASIGLRDVIVAMTKVTNSKVSNSAAHCDAIARGFNE